jgi:transcriptional regulator with XRE-family HTH domain
MSSHPATTVIGLNVRQKRTSRGLNQDVLARKAKVSRTYLNEFESGKRNATVRTLWRIAQALGTTITALVDGT